MTTMAITGITRKPRRNSTTRRSTPANTRTATKTSTTTATTVVATRTTAGFADVIRSIIVAVIIAIFTVTVVVIVIFVATSATTTTTTTATTMSTVAMPTAATKTVMRSGSSMMMMNIMTRFIAVLPNGPSSFFGGSSFTDTSRNNNNGLRLDSSFAASTSFMFVDAAAVVISPLSLRFLSTTTSSSDTTTTATTTRTSFVDSSGTQSSSSSSSSLQMNKGLFATTSIRGGGGDRGGGSKSSSASSSSKLLSRRERQRERERRYYSSTVHDDTERKKNKTFNKDDVDEADLSTTTETVSTSSSSISSPSTTTSPSSSSSPPPPLRRSQMMQSVRTGIGNLIAGTAFVGSSLMSLLTFNRDKIDDGFTMPLRALRNYLEESGVDTEVSRAVNRRLATNLALLGRVNMCQIRQERREKKRKAKKSATVIQSDTKHHRGRKKGNESASQSLVEEARRYMRYATAVYGQAMIRAAEVDARGIVDPNRGGIVTRDVIGHHISVPPEDIVLLDVDYDGDTTCLRHMLAVDHQHEKVVLSIRGTFSLSEIVVDVVGFTRPFCGGEAHTEMANYAERVWDKAGPTILECLDKHKGYELIVTGHSLGAGAACLLTVLLESKKLLSKSQKMRCFSYASPPVFTPLEFVPKARSKITNFIHQNDAISFLSVDSVRHLFQDICALDEFSRANMSRGERYRVILGTKDVPSDLIGAVVESEGKALEPKKGAPVLYIPAEENIWLQCEDEDEEGDYFVRKYGSRELVELGIKVHPEMLLDHFPARYEHAFDHLVYKNSNIN